MKTSDRGCTFLLMMAMLFFLQGCAAQRPVSPTVTVPSTAKVTLSNIFLPKEIFKSVTTGKSDSTALDKNAITASVNNGQFRAVPITAQVILYSSPTTSTYLESGGINSKISIQVWQTFLRKYKIPFQTIATVERLESSVPGVLVLPSAVALSLREKQAVTKFRSLGGSVLASWLSGIRDGNGTWQGFTFMENALDTQVVGDTTSEEDANFLMPYGDGPITYNIPAGQRIWLERVKDLYPLRLIGQQAAADILDWSRNAVLNHPLNSIVISEKPQLSGALSRTVVLGYTERLWMSALPVMMEAIAHNALLWLLRQPSVHLATWPYPFTSAVSLVVDANDVVDEIDLKFSRWFEDIGGRATYYLVTENLLKSTEAIKKLQSQGHELGYMADHFEGFKAQTEVTQSKRLITMQQQLKDANLNVGVDSGFTAPMDSMDKTTIALLNQFGLGHYLAFNDATDGRIPVAIARATGQHQNTSDLIMLPKTISGPEELMSEGNPDEGLKQFLTELEMAQIMGSLSVVRFPNQSLLTDQQLKPIFDQLRNKTKTNWLATNSKVSQWWRERSRVNVSIDTSSNELKLNIGISGSGTVNAASVIVNLPFANSNLRLLADGHQNKLTKTTTLDPWRVAVSLEGLPPGSYRWIMQFDPPNSALK